MPKVQQFMRLESHLREKLDGFVERRGWVKERVLEALVYGLVEAEDITADQVYGWIAALSKEPASAVDHTRRSKG